MEKIKIKSEKLSFSTILVRENTSFKIRLFLLFHIISLTNRLLILLGFGNSSLLFHGGRMDLGTLTVSRSGGESKNERIQPSPFIDLKINQELDKSLKIISLAVHALKPYKIFLATTMGLYIINANKYKLPPLCFNHFFSTNHSVDQVKKQEKNKIEIDNNYLKTDERLYWS